MSSVSTPPSNAPAPTHRPLARVDAIQWLRGLAAMLVVWNHAGLMVLKHVRIPDDPAHLLEWNIARLGAFGVDIFFVISGFVMAMSARRFDGAGDAGLFLAHRYNRIAPLFYLLSLVLLADMIRAQVPFTAREVSNTLTFIPWFDGSTYHWPIHYLGWTLAFEFVFYLVVAALIITGRGRQPLLLAALLLLLAAAGALTQPAWMPFRMLTSPMMVEFGFGVLAYWLFLGSAFEHHRAGWRWLAGLALVMLLLPVFADWNVIRSAVTDQFEYDGALRRLAWWGIPAFALVAAALTLSTTRFGERTRRLAGGLGDATYSIYLTHIFVMRLLEECIKRFQMPVLAAAALMLLLSPLIGVLCYRWLERPMMLAGQRRIDRFVAGRRGRGAAGGTVSG